MEHIMEVYLIIVCVHIAIRKYAKLDAVEKLPQYS